MSFQLGGKTVNGIRVFNATLFIYRKVWSPAFLNTRGIQQLETPALLAFTLHSKPNFKLSLRTYTPVFDPFLEVDYSLQKLACLIYVWTWKILCPKRSSEKLLLAHWSYSCLEENIA